MNLRRPRRSFTADYKSEVVALYRTTDKSVQEVAKEIDLTPSAVRGAGLPRQRSIAANGKA